MAAPTICALLFVIGAMVAPVRLQSDLCNTASPNTTAVPFNLTVAPGTYMANTNYTVTVVGSTNFTAVQLQAVDSSTNTILGTWTGGSGTSSCSNGSLLSNSSSTSFTAQWASPGTSQSVEIRAYITAENKLYMTKQALPAVSSTAAPMSSNATGSSNMTTFTNAPGNNQTNTSPSTVSSASQNTSIVTQTPTSVTKPTATTKSGSDKSMYSSSIMIAAIQVVFLLFVNGRQTS